MASRLLDVGNSFGDSANSLISRCSSVEDEDDDVVFVESVQPPSISAAAVADERDFIFTSSKNENPQENYSINVPSSRNFASVKGNICETIVIDDEEDLLETAGGKEKQSCNFIEWGIPGAKNRTQDSDFSSSRLSRSKNTNLGDVSDGLQSSHFGVNIQTFTPALTSQTKTGVGPFNPGRVNVAGDVFQKGESASHHNPDSWISQSASFPCNQKQPGLDSLSPLALLPKQNFLPSAQQLNTPAKIICANCKIALQKGQTAYQRKGSAHLFCSTTCLSSFSHKPCRKTRKVMCKKNGPTTNAAIVIPVESSQCFGEFSGPSSSSPYEDGQDPRKGAFNKSRCTICSKLTEIRHEVSVNNITHKLCSNDCFNKYRLANGLLMNCCEQCGEYLPRKASGTSILSIRDQQKRFCSQSCVNEYQQMMETKLKLFSASENRKRNAVRDEEEEGNSYGSSNMLMVESEEIKAEKREKTCEPQASVASSTGPFLITPNVTPSSLLTNLDRIQEQLQEERLEDSVTAGLLCADPGTWPRVLSVKQRDTLVENDPPQVRNFNFPKDNTGRRFSENYYTRILPNGERTTRSWLLYSTSKDSVFCLHCKLFGEGKNRLRNEHGCKDWQHLSHILSKHEESEVHINNSVKYSQLKSDLKKGKPVAAREPSLCGDETDDSVLLVYM
ncbi:zinc finger MYM-type protein 5 [Ochotona princeps]|uniref:zinc finger MYM-type protein 5 n=1 Tax=Ochotona princeps TaxID=9978 RepID=UPI002714C4ED|nr:zinc finger MYM-type protein 5 [Ochotona princeps]